MNPLTSNRSALEALRTQVRYFEERLAQDERFHRELDQIRGFLQHAATHLERGNRGAVQEALDDAIRHLDVLLVDLREAA